MSSARSKDADITLRALDGLGLQVILPKATSDTLLSLWDELRETSVEAAQAPTPNIYAFQENCFYFATIHLDEKGKAEKRKNAMTSSASSPRTFEPAPFQLYASDSIPDEVDSSIRWDSPFHYTYEEHERTRSFNASMYTETAIERPDCDGEMVGMVYLMSSVQDGIAPGEINIGLILKKQYRAQGYGPKAVLKVLSWVFDELKFHRVQAAVLDNLNKASALKMFTRLGFAHEGTRRRAIMTPGSDGAWKDVTCLALLDTDWMMRSSLGIKGAPKTLWDEMFLRHQREREELLQWDERSMKRTASMETLRHVANEPSVTPTASESQSAAPAALERPTMQTLWGPMPIYEKPLRAPDRAEGVPRSSIFSTPPPPPSDSESEYDYNVYESASDGDRFEEPALIDASAVHEHASGSRNPFSDAYSRMRRMSSASPPSSPEPESESDLGSIISLRIKRRRVGTPGVSSSEASDMDSNWDLMDSSSEASFNLQSASDNE